jgi:hypothetical protein
MGNRLLRVVAVLPLLFVVLSAGVAPHLHAPSPALEAMASGSQESAPLAQTLESGACVACNAQSVRLAAVPADLIPLPVSAEVTRPRRWAESSQAVSSLLAASSPPRAPPV